MSAGSDPVLARDADGDERSRIPARRRKIAAKALAGAGVLLALAASGCAPDRHDGGGVITIWAHAGRQSERVMLRSQVRRFEAARPDVHLELTFIPEGSYNGQVQAAALAGDLPDLLEFDGPYVYNYAWQGKLVPLDDLLSDSLRGEILPSILQQGTYRDRLYSLGTFDSGLGLYGRRSHLGAVGARIPTSPREAWSADELDGILAALAARDEDGAVLDLKLNQGGEWLTYGFSPALQSAGGDLVTRVGIPRADGVLNGPGSVRAMRTLQRWIRSGRVDPNLDAAAFVGGRVSLSWTGHWDYPGYAQAFGDDLVLMPLPDFGHGTRTGQGSWNWGITTSSADPHAAMEVLEFLLQPQEVLAMTDANGAVPATRIAIARSALYSAHGPLHLFVRQLREGFAVPRPRTPAYPIISSAFQKAFQDVRDGRDVQAALAAAATAIDRDVEDNHGYPTAAEMADAGEGRP